MQPKVDDRVGGVELLLQQAAWGIRIVEEVVGASEATALAGDVLDAGDHLLVAAPDRVEDLLPAIGVAASSSALGPER